MGKDHSAEKVNIDREIAQISSKVISLLTSTADSAEKRDRLKRALEKLKQLSDPFDSDVQKFVLDGIIRTEDWDGSRMDSADGKTDDMTTNLRTLKNQLDDAKSAIRAEINNLNSQISNHNSAVAAFKKLISSKSDELKRLKD